MLHAMESLSFSSTELYQVIKCFAVHFPIDSPSNALIIRYAEFRDHH